MRPTWEPGVASLGGHPHVATDPRPRCPGDEDPEPRAVQDPLSPPTPDNAMEGGAQQSSLQEPPGPGDAEQEGVPGEWDGGEGPPEVKRSQPLFIHGSR